MCTDALGNQKKTPFRLSSSPSSWWVRLPGDLPETSVINNSRASSGWSSLLNCNSGFRYMKHPLQMCNATLQICCIFTVRWWTIVLIRASMYDKLWRKGRHHCRGALLGSSPSLARRHLQTRTWKWGCNRLSPTKTGHQGMPRDDQHPSQKREITQELLAKSCPASRLPIRIDFNSF